ncbi:unnamed protein product [Effrenium voratum]|nr:unnamed protein product [Effrenium voratum]
MSKVFDGSGHPLWVLSCSTSSRCFWLDSILERGAASPRTLDIMAKSSLLPAILAAFALGSLSFVGYQPAARTADNRVAMRGAAVEWDPKLSRDVVEVMFTAPAQGARARMLVRSDADVMEVLKDGRKKLGFDQEWMPDTDFKLYNAEDEDAGPMKGKMKDNGLIDFSFEIHMYYEPQ